MGVNLKKKRNQFFIKLFLNLTVALSISLSGLNALQANRALKLIGL
jgi:hypothetical protein